MIDKLLIAIKRYGIETVFRRYYSIYMAQVTAIDDPRGKYAVEIVVPELFGNKPMANWAIPVVHSGKDTDASDSITGGKFCAKFFPPKVGDNILVYFDKGSQDYPRYFDMGWFGNGKIPELLVERIGKNDLNSIFISRYGHFIIVDEADGAAKIWMKTNYGLEFIMDETKDQEKIEIKTTKGHKITISDGEEHITVQDFNGNKFQFDTKNKDCNLEIKRDWNIKIVGDVNMDVTGDVIANCENLDFTTRENANITVGGDAEINVTGNGKITTGGDTDIEASGDCNIKGSTINLNGNASPATSLASHQGVIDTISGIPIVPSNTVFLDK